MIDRQMIQYRVRNDKTTEQEVRVRCDMCGVEHDFTLTVEPRGDDLHVYLKTNRPSAMIYQGHTESHSIIE